MMTIPQVEEHHSQSQADACMPLPSPLFRGLPSFICNAPACLLPGKRRRASSAVQTRACMLLRTRCILRHQPASSTDQVLNRQAHTTCAYPHYRLRRRRPVLAYTTIWHTMPPPSFVSCATAALLPGNTLLRTPSPQSRLVVWSSGAAPPCPDNTHVPHSTL